jgi:sugar diacid utilization regulator
LYSREIAFAAADVYARAAEARGLWDARLEALVVDSILSGEYDQELPSRIAALGWTGHGEVSVFVGTSPRIVDVDQIRRIARHHVADVLVGIQGKRLVVVVGRRIDDDHDHTTQFSFTDIAHALDECFGPGAFVVGPTVPAVVDAVKSAKAALAGFSVAKSWRSAPRPLLADDALPERALAGDPLARAMLIGTIYEPLRDHPLDLLGTVWTYFETGHSLEATARELFVHPNTVRYRLKKVAEVLDWDPGVARDALTMHLAIILGAMMEPNNPPGPRAGDV